MGIIAWIIVGLIAGLLARAVMPGRQPMGLLMTTLLGMVGAVIGGLIGSAAFGRGADFSLGGILIAGLGAVLVLFLYGMVAGRPRHRTV
ncbi:MAG: GlsB/YeaQ/YmgE family stress response membrane protein [Myxococcales bacterium]